MRSRTLCGDSPGEVPHDARDVWHILVDPDFQRRGVAHALMCQLRTNLLALGVGSIRTEVDWDDQSMLAFFHREGFRPAPRICLELDCEAHRGREERAV